MDVVFMWLLHEEPSMAMVVHQLFLPWQAGHRSFLRCTVSNTHSGLLLHFCGFIVVWFGIAGTALYTSFLLLLVPGCCPGLFFVLCATHSV